MGNGNDSISPADHLSEELVEQLNTLGAQQLRAVREYVNERLSHMGPPTEAEVRADTTEAVVDVARHDIYTLVWKRSTKEDETDEESTTSLYLVRRERTPDGEERLNWSYLGAVEDAVETECVACGTVIESYTNTCPHCGSKLDRRQEEE